jgi:hypothetical protein
MSYDIKFKVKVEGVNLWVDTGECSANTTWNVRDMIIKSTGLEWKNTKNNGLCKDVIPKIENGFWELTDYPEKYKQYESENGWGTIDGTKRFFQEILRSWKMIVEYEPELVDVLTFWIE